MAVVQSGAAGVTGAVLPDGAEDGALELRLAALDEQEARRSPAAFCFRPGDAARGVPPRADGAGGDHGAVQARVP
jgi:hypothetical protein